MPLDRPEMVGTESDGTKSTKYCKYCYVEGKFVNPDMTLEEMKTLVRAKLEERHMSESMIQQAVLTVPLLGRWIGRPARVESK